MHIKNITTTVLLSSARLRLRLVIILCVLLLWTTFTMFLAWTSERSTAFIERHNNLFSCVYFLFISDFDRCSFERSRTPAAEWVAYPLLWYETLCLRLCIVCSFTFSLSCCSRVSPTIWTSQGAGERMSPIISPFPRFPCYYIHIKKV